MKRYLLIFITLFISTITLAQEKKDYDVKFSGFIRNDAVYNSRQVVSARGEGVFFLAPAAVSLDAEGNDVNAAPNFNIVGIGSRLRAKVSAPETFGAKTTGLLEGDFFGVNSTTKFSYRLRHAYMNFEWEKSELLVGQFWHATFVPECFPATVSFNAGVPFNPLSRNPQVKFTRKFGNFKVFATAMSQGHFLSQEINGNANSHRNAVIPELHAQIQYKKNNLIAGAGFGYQSLRPELKTKKGYITETKVNSSTIFGFAKLTTKPVTVKAWGMYGQNNDNEVMMGGYAKIDKIYSAADTTKGFSEYTPFNTLTAWTDIHTNGKKFQAGIFAGYSENLGAGKDIISGTFVGRWGDVHSMTRVSPRLVYFSGNTSLGAEVDFSVANYKDGANSIDSKGVVTKYKAVRNTGIFLSLSHNF